ncbi:MAG TPA: hypothetical protein VM689_10350 [Aliidongia sp.]|nr:hypothetical protein [Aliidongia sp.]
MPVVLGPVIKKEGGYGFDIWVADKGLSYGFPYRRLEDAYYARKARIGESVQQGAESIACHTMEEFLAETARRTGM